MKPQTDLPDLWVVEAPFLAFHVFPLKDAKRTVCGHKSPYAWPEDPRFVPVESHPPKLVPLTERGGIEGWREQFTHCHSCERVLRARGYLEEFHHDSA